MNRRELLKTAAAALMCPRWSWADDLPPDIKITRVLSFDLPCKRSKFVGKNSRLGDHGAGSTDRMARIYTSGGVEGIGICRANKERCTEILGKTLQELYRQARRYEYVRL